LAIPKEFLKIENLKKSEQKNIEFQAENTTENTTEKYDRKNQMNRKK